MSLIYCSTVSIVIKLIDFVIFQFVTFSFLFHMATPSLRITIGRVSHYYYSIRFICCKSLTDIHCALYRYDNCVEQPKASELSIPETPVASAEAECMAALAVTGNASNEVTESNGECDDSLKAPSRSAALCHATTGEDILAQLVEWSRETSG